LQISLPGFEPRFFRPKDGKLPTLSPVKTLQQVNYGKNSEVNNALYVCGEYQFSDALGAK
jgi:hypothetical protein